jgi:hypothetical protein
LPEAISFESRRHGGFLDERIVARFRFVRRDIPDRLQQPSIVEPVDPFERGELDGLEAAPRPASVNDLGRVETVDRFSERVVLGVADAADRRFNAGLRQAFGVLDRHVLGGFNRSSQCFVCWPL